MTANKLTFSSRTQPQAGASNIFQIILHRAHCRPDSNWAARPDGRSHDSIKPLALHGINLSRTIIIDDAARKIVPEEASCALVVPEYRDSTRFVECDDAFETKGGAVTKVPVLRALCHALLATLGTAGPEVDVRPHLTTVRSALDQARVRQSAFGFCIVSMHLSIRRIFFYGGTSIACPIVSNYREPVHPHLINCLFTLFRISRLLPGRQYCCIPKGRPSNA
jgi:hypothetical protein